MDLRIKHALEIINENYKDNICLKRLAQEVALSPSHFQYLFKEETGQPYRSYRRKLRLIQARELLKDWRLRISEIVYRVGYSNSSSFTRDFKKLFKETPSGYRRNALS